MLGTVTYMSPEQAAGREVDARADIWSLGVVLYEMVTMRAPFDGASKSHIIVAITDHEPQPVSDFAPDIPEPLEYIIAEALTKDREERTQTSRFHERVRRIRQMTFADERLLGVGAVVDVRVENQLGSGMRSPVVANGDCARDPW